MTITISIDPTYPTFAALDADSLRQVQVGLGPTGMNTMFFSYDPYPLNFGTIGDGGVNQAALAVTYRRPLTFSHEAFGVFGDISNTDYSASRLATLLADYVKRGVLVVTDNAAVVAGATATATLAVTTPIVLTDAPGGDDGAARNATTFTIAVEAAAANPLDTILADFTGSAAAILVTITPNDGTNNGAVTVDLTTTELVELINTGAVTGKTVTLTDTLSLRALQTGVGGDATALADAGEGDGVSAAFAGGVDGVSGAMTAAQILLFAP